MRKFLFPLMVVLAGIMISGSTCTPDCCVPGTTLITAVSPTSFTFDWDDTTPGVVTVTVFTPIPPIPAVTWQATAPAGWNVAPAGVQTGSGTFTILPDVNNTGAEKKGIITITTANGDKATVAVTQSANLVSEAVADNLAEIHDIVEENMTGVNGVGAGSAAAVAAPIAPPYYTPVIGGLTAAPTTVVLNGRTLVPDEIPLSVGFNHFVKFYEYAYDSEVLYIATTLLDFEGTSGNITLVVDGETYTLGYTASPNTLVIDDITFVGLPNGSGTYPTSPTSTCVYNSTTKTVDIKFVEPTGPYVSPAIYITFDGTGIVPPLVGVNSAPWDNTKIMFKTTVTVYDAKGSSTILSGPTTSFGSGGLMLNGTSDPSEYYYFIPYGVAPVIDSYRVEEHTTYIMGVGTVTFTINTEYVL